MSISSVSGGGSALSMQDIFSSAFQSKGVSSDKAKELAAEVDQAAKSAMSSGSKSPTDVRAAIEAQLTKDVDSGTITADDATKVRSALDEFEKSRGANGGPQGTPPQGGPPPGGPPPGGGKGEKDSASGTDSSSSSSLDTLLELLKTSLSDSSNSDSTSSTTTSTSDSTTSSTDVTSYLKKILSSGLVDTSV
jgi:hypothetical protein